MKMILLVIAMLALLVVAGCGSSNPANPGTLTVTAANTLSWSSVSGATSYNVYRGTTSGGMSSKTFLQNVTVTTFTDITAVPGTTYYYQVTAVISGVGESAASNEVNSNSAPPSGVTATAGDSEATIAWTAISGAASYNIYWSTTSGVTPANGGKIAGVTSPYINTGLTDGTTYYFVVTAVIGTLESNPSSQVYCTPMLQTPVAPSMVTATPGNGQVTITWGAIPNAASYKIYWATTSGVTATGTPIDCTATTYSQTGLQNGKTYYYVVTAVNSVGESTASAQMSAIPALAPTPAAPPVVTATSSSDGAVTISWPPVPAALSYNIYYSTAPLVTTGVGTNGTVVTSAANPYIQTGLTDGTVYYYVVTAVGVNGESTPSPQVSVIPAIPVPPAPNTVTAVAGNSQMTISWQPVLGAASYVVYLSTTTGVTPANGYAEPSTSSTFILTGLSNGTTYYGVVTAVNASGASTASSQVSATPIASAASATAPVVTATPGDGQVNLTWTAVSGANSYNIYWSNTPGVTPLTGTQISGVNGSYPHTGLTNSKTYYYVVTAVTDSGESAPSSQVSAIPAVAPTAAAPAVVTVSPGTKEVTIAWTPVSGATSYNIYWSTTSEVTPANGTKIPLATNPYTQTGLNSGTTYYYVITSVDGNGESTASPQVFASPL